MSRSLKSTGERSFTISNAYHVDGCKTKFSHKDYTGRFINNDPADAASKALTMLCRAKGIRGQCTLYIEMRETTQGSKHKHYAYHCKRVKYDKPQEVAGSIRMYHNVVKSTRIPTEKCMKSHKSPGPMRGSHRSTKSKSMSRTKKHH
jgi:hypothetical protein